MLDDLAPTKPSPRRPSLSGGCVCSLSYRPRRWFGYRLEEVLAEFLSNEEPRLSGLRAAIVDLLRGAVRSDLDERVLVSAHQSGPRSAALVTVTVFYRLPSTDAEHLGQVLTELGRGSLATSHYRMAHGSALPVRARLRIRTSVVGMERGESSLVTTLTAVARATLPPRSSSPAEEGRRVS